MEVLEIIIVAAVAGWALWRVGRALWQSLSGRNSACGCSAQCPMSKEGKCKGG